MIHLSATDARQGFSDLIHRIEYGGERAILQRHGKDVAAIVPIEDVVLLEVLDEQLDIEETRADLRAAFKQGTTSVSQLRSEMGLA